MKIGNLRTTKTPKQELDRWSELKSHRNKLLLNSDWTQARDSNLTEANIGFWADWRRELKRINRSNYASIEQAKKALDALAKQEPMVEYEDETYLRNADYPDYETKSFSMKKEALSKALSKRFDAMLDKHEFLEHPAIISEQYEEALLYLGNKGVKLENFPLINLEVELTKSTADDVAAKFIQQKRNRLRAIIALRRKFSYFEDAINSASTMLELDTIQRELQQWTLTLT